MTATALTLENREKLKRVSTATLTTALFKRGLRNQFIQDVRPLSANAPRMVGEAFTLRYIPAREDLDHLSVFEGTQHPQRVAVETCPPDIAALGFAAYHSRPSAPTNLIHHHALDINAPIGCGDVPVYPGDIVVGDGEGVCVIPAHLANEVAAEAYEQTAYEDFVEMKVREGRGIFGLYPANAETKAEFARWRPDWK
jgi:regulator of RNase E activity RraA